MKGIEWVKPYKYVKVPVYLINFWKIRLFKIGYKKRRVGCKKTSDEIYSLYSKLLSNE